MRPDIKFASPHQRAKPCARAYCGIRSSQRCLSQKIEKFPLPEPEKMTTLPEDEGLMPENKPEKNLKIQLRSGFRSVRSPLPPNLKPLNFLGHSHNFERTPQKAPPFTLFRFVPLCSVKKFISRFYRSTKPGSILQWSNNLIG